MILDKFSGTKLFEAIFVGILIIDYFPAITKLKYYPRCFDKPYLTSTLDKHVCFSFSFSFSFYQQNVISLCDRVEVFSCFLYILLFFWSFEFWELTGAERRAS